MGRKISGETARFLLLSIIFILIFFLKDLNLKETIKNIRGIVFTKSSTSGNRVTIAIPISPIIYRIPLEMALMHNFYQAEGLALDMINMRSNIDIDTIDTALSSKGIDFSGSVPSTIHNALAGLPIKIIFFSARNRPSFLVAQKSIRSLSDLRGRKIGVNDLDGSEYLIIAATLRHFGFDPKGHSSFVRVWPEMKLATFATGSIDGIAATTTEKIMLARRGFNVLIRMSDIKGFLSGGLGVTKKRLLENRLQAKKVIRGTFKGLILVRENSNEVIDFMRKRWGFDKAMGKEEYEENLRYLTTKGEVEEELVKQEIEMGRMLEINGNSKIVPSDIVDYTLLREVQRELGITSIH